MPRGKPIEQTLFELESPPEPSAPWSFAPSLDILFRERAQATPTSIVYSIEMINDIQVMLGGATPTGKHKNGGPSWKGAKDHAKCVVALEEYRKCFPGKAT